MVQRDGIEKILQVIIEKMRKREPILNRVVQSLHLLVAVIAQKLARQSKPTYMVQVQ